MLKRFLLPLSLVNQVALLMLLLGLLGIAGMSVSSWMSQSIQGNAHAINKAGSLRMQSYRLLSMVPLSAENEAYLQELEDDEISSDLQQAVRREGLSEQFTALRIFWLGNLRPHLQQAGHPDDAASDVALFVQQLDDLVSAIDHKTEQRLVMVTLVQRAFIGHHVHSVGRHFLLSASPLVNPVATVSVDGASHRPRRFHPTHRH